MYVGEENTAKRKLSNWKKKKIRTDNIIKIKVWLPKVTLSYCEFLYTRVDTSTSHTDTPAPLTPALTFIPVVYSWHPSLSNGSFLFIRINIKASFQVCF